MIDSDFTRSSPQAVRLADWGVIRARGEDAATFLHGQLTQDMATLARGEARLAGWCSPKGRLLATFIAWRAAPDEILLACSADVLAGALKRLSMFVLRAKCRLSDATDELPVWGLVHPSSNGVRVDDPGPAWPASPWRVGEWAGGACVRLDDAAGAERGLWIGPAGVAAPLPATTDPTLWNWLEVQSAVPRVVARTADAFVPQMVNFELVGGVNFQKGCYPGQEVVARSQYRGTVKRRMFLVESAVGAEPGMEVYAAADAAQPAGIVVLAAPRPAGHAPDTTAAYALLLEAKREAADAGPLRLGAGDGPALARMPLPYALPSDAAA
ncbi:MAG TPA: folate-binding protein [Burkholderiaceae bacterium]|jgi:hypothetical protein|nr:folate-binding protein [Burkholderiaceae bacterium]